jgi:hypothetical protein
MICKIQLFAYSWDGVFFLSRRTTHVVRHERQIEHRVPLDNGEDQDDNNETDYLIQFCTPRNCHNLVLLLFGCLVIVLFRRRVKPDVILISRITHKNKNSWRADNKYLPLSSPFELQASSCLSSSSSWMVFSLYPELLVVFQTYQKMSTTTIIWTT